MGYKKGENGFALICNDAEYVGNITLTLLFIQHLSEKVYHSFSIWRRETAPSTFYIRHIYDLCKTSKKNMPRRFVIDIENEILKHCHLQSKYFILILCIALQKYILFIIETKLKNVCVLYKQIYYC